MPKKQSTHLEAKPNRESKIKIAVELTESEAAHLAQLLKQASFNLTEILNDPLSDPIEKEAPGVMIKAVAKVIHALSIQGVNPC